MSGLISVLPVPGRLGLQNLPVHSPQHPRQLPDALKYLKVQNEKADNSTPPLTGWKEHRGNESALPLHLRMLRP